MDHLMERDRHLADLMRSAQDGDHSAYVRLLEEVTPLLRQVVSRHRHFLQPADVEDLIQDIFIVSARGTRHIGSSLPGRER